MRMILVVAVCSVSFGIVGYWVFAQLSWRNECMNRGGAGAEHQGRPVCLDPAAVR